MGARALLLLAALSLLAPAPARAFVVALSAPGPPPAAAAAAGAWRHRHLLPQRTMVPLRVPKRTFGVLLTSVAGPQNEDRRTVNSPAPGWRIPAAVAAVAVAAVLFARPLAAAALHPKADSGEAASVRARWARPAPTLLVAIPGRSEVAQAKDDSQQQAIGARRSVFSIAASLVVAAVGAIILGIPASVLLLASFALPDLSNAVRATLVLVALPFAAVKFLPRVSKLRFNLEEFAKSDFFKLFDFWRLLDSALGGDRRPAGDSEAIMPRMTPEREASLPKADPVWVNLNKELWASKDVIRALEQENQDGGMLVTVDQIVIPTLGAYFDSI